MTALAQTIERLERAGSLVRARKAVGDAAEAAAVAAALDARDRKAGLFVTAGGPPIACNLLADRARLAAALGAPAPGLPGWVAERLGELPAPRETAGAWEGDGAAAWAPLRQGASAPFGAVLVLPSGAFALVTARVAAADRIEIGPLPWRHRAAAAEAARAGGGQAALLLGAPPAVLVAAALAGGMAVDAAGAAGALAGGRLSVARPSDDLPPVPAETAVVLGGPLAAGADEASCVLTPAAAFARRDPVLHLLPGGRGGRELLALEALAAETVLFRHVGSVEGGLDMLDVFCVPETENRLVVIKLRPRVGGQSKTALMAALSSPHLAPEVAIAVDDDIDVFDLRDVVWSWASRVHGEVDIAQIDGLALAAPDRGPASAARAGAKWFVDSTMAPLTQPDRRDVFVRAIPKNLAKVELKDFLPNRW